MAGGGSISGENTRSGVDIGVCTMGCKGANPIAGT
jgi:hypothetical protein